MVSTTTTSAASGNGNEEALSIFGQGPILSRRLEGHHGKQARVAVAEAWIDDGEGWVVVHYDHDIGGEVELAATEGATFGEAFDFTDALLLRGWRGARFSIHPGCRRAAGIGAPAASLVTLTRRTTFSNSRSGPEGDFAGSLARSISNLTIAPFCDFVSMKTPFV